MLKEAQCNCGNMVDDLQKQYTPWPDLDVTLFSCGNKIMILGNHVGMYIAKLYTYVVRYTYVAIYHL